MVESKYEWILNRTTVVEEVKQEEDKDVFSPPVAFSFIPFSGLQQYIESNSQVDIIAVATNIQPPRTIQTCHGPTRIQEIYLLNEEKTEIILTVWNDYLDDERATIANVISTKPIIVAKRLKVTTYQNNVKAEEEKIKAVARCCIQIYIHDSTGTLPATVFGELAESFIHYNAKKLMEETTEDGILKAENLINISTTKKYIIHIKTTKYEFC